MPVDVKGMLHSRMGSIAMSIILGLGLATFFRKACNDRNCIVFKAPPMKKMNKQIYKYNGKCYKFTTEATKCNNNKKSVQFS